MKSRPGSRRALLLTALLLAACAPREAPLVAPPLDVEQTHAIFAAAIEFTAQAEGGALPFAAGTRTESWDLLGHSARPEPAMQGIDPGWVESRPGLDAAPCAIDVALLGQTAAKVVQLTGDEQQHLRSFGYSQSDEEIRAVHGARSAIHLSRPLVTPAGNRAVISVGVLCGMLCGSGKYLVLERTDTGWHVVASFWRWAS